MPGARTVSGLPVSVGLNPAAPICDRMAMRLLLIEEDSRRCAEIRQRVALWRPDAELVVRDPVLQGALPPEFLAQGFDAVLLAGEWSGGSGLAWAKELAGRAGFAPIVLLSGRDSLFAGRSWWCAVARAVIVVMPGRA